MSSENLVVVDDLSLSFGRHRVLDSVGLQVAARTAVGIVGESGSGKSTLAKVLVGTHTPASGHVSVAGIDVVNASHAERARLRRTVQLIPQDPYSSLDPRRTIGQTLAEAIDPRHPSVRRSRARILELLDQVRMPADALSLYPHEFSGGQRQRIAIARGLAVSPTVIVADEITSALDVSVQAEVLDLIARLRAELQITLLFISHNLAVVSAVCDEVVVMQHGQIVERGPVAVVFGAPQHPYTQRLLSSAPGAPGFTLDAPALDAIHERTAS